MTSPMRHRKSVTASLITAALVLLVAGCQPLPQPFKPDARQKEDNPLLTLPNDSGGMVVRPVAGMPGKDGEALAHAMASELLRRDVPAFTDGGNRKSYVLTGEAMGIPRNSLRTEVRVIWKLANARGIQVGRKVVDVATRHSAWTKGSPRLVHSIAAASAGPVAEIIQQPAPVDKLAALPKRTLYVLPIKGAPKAAGELLRSEMETSLQQSNLRIAMNRGTDSLTVAGVVSMAPEPPGKRRLSLEWTVTGSNGRKLGTLHQSHSVTAQELNDNWPQMARAIAAGAARGVKDILNKTPESALEPAKK